MKSEIEPHLEQLLAEGSFSTSLNLKIYGGLLKQMLKKYSQTDGYQN